MAIFNVAGTILGITAAVPTINPGDTPAAIIAAYDALTYTTQDTCLITTLPIVQRDWNTNTDPLTVCGGQNVNQLRRQFKTDRIAPNANLGALMDYQDPFIQVMFALQESLDQVGTYEIIHPNGTDKIWGQIQVKSVAVDMTDNESRALFTSEVFYEAWPVFSAI